MDLSHKLDNETFSDFLRCNTISNPIFCNMEERQALSFYATILHDMIEEGE